MLLSYTNPNILEMPGAKHLDKAHDSVAGESTGGIGGFFSCSESVWPVPSFPDIRILSQQFTSSIPQTADYSFKCKEIEIILIIMFKS